MIWSITSPARAAACTAVILAASLAQDAPGPGRDVEITVTEGTSMAVAASPDRLWIAIDLLGSVWVLPFRGGEARRITPTTLEAHRPTWAPDGRTVAFQGFGDDGAWHLYSVGINHEGLKQITRSTFDDREPAWSHDGSRMLFSSNRGGGSPTIWEVTLASGATRRVARRPGTMPSWRPGDDGFLFASYDPRQKDTDGIWATDLDGRERLAVPAPTGFVGSPAISPDGELIACVDAGRLRIGLQPVTPSEEVFQSRPQWLSRNEILYSADGHIKRRALNGLSTEIRFQARVSLTRPTYTAVHRVLEPSGPQRLVGIVNPAVSPDGTRIAFTALGDLWILPIGDRPIRLTSDQFVELDPAWSPDGTRIAFGSDRGGSMALWVHDFRAGIAALMSKGRGRVSGTAWSPDGRLIAYAANRDELFAFDSRTNTEVGGWVPGTVNREEAEPMPLFGQLGRATWGPDSRALAFDAERNDPNHILVYRFDEHVTRGALLQPDPSITRDINSPAWSPNGVKMVFAADGRLWVVPVDPTTATATSMPVSIAEEFSESPSWDADSRRLVYLTPSGLRRLSDGGPLEPVVADLGWAPSRPPRRVVVHAGQVFDGRSDALRGQTDIVIENGVIADVTPHTDDLHAGAVVDAGEETVLPGFIDARTSIDPTYGEALGRIWLAYGITSVRDVALPAYAGIEQREAIGHGRRIGPRVFIAGEPFDGRRIGHSTSIASDQQIEPALARATLLGVDFLTMRGRLGGSFERRLANYAHARGLRATTGDLFAAIAFGFDELDMPMGRSYRDVIDAIGQSEMMLAPMLSRAGGFQLSYETDRSWLQDPRLALFPAPLARRYEALAARLPRLADQQIVRRLEESIKPRREAVKAIAAAGGRIVAGTDAPLGDLPYGLSLHSELEQLVLAGMPPFRVLQAATSTAAEALGVGDELGTIEPGKIADLVFLGGDPRQDIRRTRDVRRVMRGGRVYDAASLGIPQQSPR